MNRGDIVCVMDPQNPVYGIVASDQGEIIYVKPWPEVVDLGWQNAEVIEAPEERCQPAGSWRPVVPRIVRILKELRAVEVPEAIEVYQIDGESITTIEFPVDQIYQEIFGPGEEAAGPETVEAPEVPMLFWNQGDGDQVAVTFVRRSEKRVLVTYLEESGEARSSWVDPSRLYWMYTDGPEPYEQDDT